MGYEYLRTATHPGIFERLFTHNEAARNVEALLKLPHCRVIGEDDSFWESYREITADVPTRGNLVPDAHSAAILIRHGVTVLHTHDRDFLKFSFLSVRDLLV